MHDGSITQGDTWLNDNIDSYAQWAKTHNSLLIVTFDEDDEAHGNHIATIFYGANIQSGRYTQKINHYVVLRTIENMYALPPMARSARVGAISSIWAAAPAASGNVLR
jgi:acid phosphatase